MFSTSIFFCGGNGKDSDDLVHQCLYVPGITDSSINNMKRVILLMEEILHHLGCIKPCKYWDKLPTSTGAGFLPSTVGTNSHYKSIVASSIQAIYCQVFTGVWLIPAPFCQIPAPVKIDSQRPTIFKGWEQRSPEKEESCQVLSSSEQLKKKVYMYIYIFVSMYVYVYLYIT